MDKLLYWALKGEHDTFSFGSVSTTKHAFNPVKKESDSGTADSLLCFNKEWTSLVKASCWFLQNFNETSQGQPGERWVGPSEELRSQASPFWDHAN